MMNFGGFGENIVAIGYVAVYYGVPGQGHANCYKHVPLGGMHDPVMLTREQIGKVEEKRCIECGKLLLMLAKPLTDWNGNPIPVQGKPGKDINPCVLQYGPGPEGATCGTCSHLFGHARSKVWYKCAKRPFTHGAATDHKTRWPACGQYEKLKGERRIEYDPK